MSSLRSTLAMSLVPACLVLLAGCAVPRSYTILYLQTGRKTPVYPETSARELILGVNDATKTFRVFGRSPSGRGGFTVRTISYLDGQVLDRKEAPIFSAYYRLGYAYGLGFAVSPSSKRIAYVDEPSKSLIIFDTYTGDNSVLRTNFASSIVGPATLLEWVSDDELIAAGDDPPSGKRVLALYSVADRSLILELHPNGLWRCVYALSPSRDDFAY